MSASPHVLIDTIDWNALSHAYGDAASDTPILLRALSSDDAKEREKARHDLSLSVIHQGTHWAAAPAATKCIVDIALAPDARDLFALLDLLTYLATGFEWRWARAIDGIAKIGTEEDGYWRGSHEAIEARLDGFVKMIGSSLDRNARAGAAMLVAFFPSRAADSAPALQAALADPDRRMAGTAALSLAALARLGAIAPPRDSLLALLRGDAPRTLAGDGAALGLAWMGHAKDDEVVERLAIVSVADDADDADDRLPFHGCSASLALEPYVTEAPQRILDATFELLVEARSPHASRVWNEQRVALLLDADFPMRDDHRAFAVEELGPRQLRWLRALTRVTCIASGNLANLLRGRGLPTGLDRLGKFLGVDDPDLLEARRRFTMPDGRAVYWPVWRFLHALTYLEASVAHGGAEIARSLSTREIAALTTRYERALWDTCELGEVRGHLSEALRAKVGVGEPPPIDPAYGEYPRWKTDARVRDAMLDLWAASLEGDDLAHADALVAASLGHAPPAQPWLDALLDAMPLERRERIVLASFELAAAPAGDLACSESCVSGPAPRVAPWMHLTAAPTKQVALALLDLVARVLACDVPWEEVLDFFALLPQPDFNAIVAKGTPSTTLRRAAFVRAGGVPDDAALRWDLRQWFRDGATLSSGQTPGWLLPPCPLCAQVYRELGIHPLDIGDGARGGILAPEEFDPSDAPQRRVCWIRAHWQPRFDVDEAKASEPWSDNDEDPAIAEAITNALVSRPELEMPDRSCVELRALSMFAKKLRSTYVVSAPSSTRPRPR
jgi:hypothetical protein